MHCGKLSDGNVPCQVIFCQDVRVHRPFCFTRYPISAVVRHTYLLFGKSDFGCVPSARPLVPLDKKEYRTGLLPAKSTSPFSGGGEEVILRSLRAKWRILISLRAVKDIAMFEASGKILEALGFDSCCLPRLTLGTKLVIPWSGLP